MLEYWKDYTLLQKIKIISKIVVLLLVIVFCVQNWQTTELSLITWKVPISLTFLMFVCLIIGFVAASLFDQRKFREKNTEIKALKEALENEKRKKHEEQ